LEPNEAEFVVESPAFLQFTLTIEGCFFFTPARLRVTIVPKLPATAGFRSGVRPDIILRRDPDRRRRRNVLTSLGHAASLRRNVRILILSDIHGNWPALAAINEPHDVCLCLGDLVDYGPDPGPCVRWAMQHAHHAIRGNHDHGVAQGVDVTGDAGFRFLTRASRPWQWPALGHEERQYLLRLPLTKRLVFDDIRYFLVHGTPRDPLDEYLLKDPDSWGRRLEGIDADIVCVGHTHQQFNLRVGDKIVLNPGSVGQPRDGDPRAAYAVIDEGKIELKRVAYPVEETIAHIQASAIPENAKRLLAECLRLGRLPQNNGSHSNGEPAPSSQARPD
jgi:putative phosphoesterase